jgi:hypothetical protein
MMATKKSQPIYSAFQRPGTFNRPATPPHPIYSAFQRPGQFNRPKVTPGYTPLPGAGAPAAPGAPAGPAPTAAAPEDAAYRAAIEGLARQRGLSQGGLLGQRQRTLSDYGYQEGSFNPADYDPANPQKSYGTLTFDPANPFSKAALLKQTYDTSRRASAQTMGAGGQLYAGAFQNQQDLVNRQQLGAEDQLQKSLTDFLAQNTIDFGQTGVDYTQGVGQAALNAAGRAADNPLYEPVTPAPAAAAASRATKATASVGRPQKTVSGKRYYQRASDGKWIPL